jgi:hypothetical protein
MKKSLSFLMAGSLTFLLAGCSQKPPVPEMHYSSLEVCRAAVSKMFYVPVSMVSAHKKGDIVQLSYTTTQKTWHLHCQLHGNQIWWGKDTDKTPWENGRYDPLLWFQVNQNALFIYENYNRVKTDCNPTVYGPSDFQRSNSGQPQL